MHTYNNKHYIIHTMCVSLSLSIYIYIYIYTHMYMYVCIHIYIYIYTYVRTWYTRVAPTWAAMLGEVLCWYVAAR